MRSTVLANPCKLLTSMPRTKGKPTVSKQHTSGKLQHKPTHCRTLTRWRQMHTCTCHQHPPLSAPGSSSPCCVLRLLEALHQQGVALQWFDSSTSSEHCCGSRDCNMSRAALPNSTPRPSQATSNASQEFKADQRQISRTMQLQLAGTWHLPQTLCCSRVCFGCLHTCAWVCFQLPSQRACQPC
jgi:hypothetical protein